MIWLYRLLYLPVFLLSLPHYGSRMLKRGGYGRDLRHRFGRVPRLAPPAPGKKRVWIQAVSVGELVAVTPLLQQLAKRPDTEVVLTTTSSTGYTYAQDNLSPLVLALAAFPWDFWLFSAAAWKRFQPTQAVLMEGELWPEHLHQAKRRGVPVALLNGRVSDRSLRRHKKFAWWLQGLTFRRLAAVAAGSAGDAERFRLLGVPATQVVTAGNLKFEVSVEPVLTPEQIAGLRKELGFADNPDALVLLGSSTWPGEESALISALTLARGRGLDARLLLVPRHAERRSEVMDHVRRAGLPCHQRSVSRQAPPGTVIHLADTTGELRHLTQAADVVFIGKSLEPHTGGQTPIEAAALGRALILGPRLDNFREAVKSLLEQEGAVQLTGAEELGALCYTLLSQPNRRSLLGRSAQAWHTSNTGALERNLAVLDGI